MALIFEGLARKLAPQSLGILIFFFKDILAVALLLLCMRETSNVEASRWLGVMGMLTVLISPCVAWTALNDPLLALFGAKQYVLFVSVTVAMCTAYLPNHRRQMFALFQLIGLSVVVTTLVAVAQNRLPAGHWLNLSVGGEDLSRFAAGGYLRVSSTFSFVGQYCFYLNALCFCLPAYFYFNKFFHGTAVVIQSIALIGLAIVGSFVTGSRGSVVGNAAILGVGGMLAMAIGGGKGFVKVVLAVLAGALLIVGVRSWYPEFFAAYEIRSAGTVETTHATQIEARVTAALLDWTHGSPQAPPSILGYGLGVMSNGSEKLSYYAAEWRSSGFWTETDQATTFFEGGWYLVWIWYGFRIWIIARCLFLVLKLRDEELRIAASFAWGYVLIIGVTGTLSIQPPLAVWWWLAVGLISCLSRFDHAPSLSGHVSRT